MQRCETSRISIGLKSCCIGNRGAAGEFVGFLQVIYHHHPSTLCSLRRSGHPLSSWYQSSSVYSVSIHKSIPVDLLFFVLYRKAKKILGLEFAIALDCIGLQVVVAGRFPFRFVSLVSGSSLFSLVFVQFSVGNFVKPQLLHTNFVFHVRPLKIVVGKNRI